MPPNSEVFSVSILDAINTYQRSVIADQFEFWTLFLPF